MPARDAAERNLGEIAAIAARGVSQGTSSFAIDPPSRDEVTAR